MSTFPLVNPAFVSTVKTTQNLLIITVTVRVQKITATEIAVRFFSIETVKCYIYFNVINVSV